MTPIEFHTLEEVKQISKQDRPMQVFIMGMPRSGTLSLVAGFKILGYTPYGFVDRMLLGHMPLWTEALNAKFMDKGKPWARPEFNHVFKGFDCVFDVPCIFFTEELVDAYPQALFILNKRSLDTWHASMENTLFRVFQWRSWPLLARLDPALAGKWYTHCILTWSVFCNNDYGPVCKDMALDHYDHVREVVPKDRLLEFEVKEGWEPLCRFLGKEVPAGKGFPNVNDGDTFLEWHTKLWLYCILHAVGNVAVGLLSVLVAGIAWYFYASK